MRPAFIAFFIAAAASAQSPSSVRGYWDDVFRRGRIQFNKNASKLVQLAIRDHKPGLAIDLGMGEGRNAVFLAQQG